MFIPKSKMPLILDVIDFYIETQEVDDQLVNDDLELLNQIRDRITLCQQGDAPFLEIEVCYSNNPCANIKLPFCTNCGGEIINGTCYNC